MVRTRARQIHVVPIHAGRTRVALDIIHVRRTRVLQIHAQLVTAPVVQIRVVRDTTLVRQARALPILVRPIIPVQRHHAAPIRAPRLVPVRQGIRMLRITHVVLRLVPRHRVLHHRVRQRQATRVQPAILAQPIIRAARGTLAVRFDRAQCGMHL